MDKQEKQIFELIVARGKNVVYWYSDDVVISGPFINQFKQVYYEVKSDDNIYQEFSILAVVYKGSK